MKTMAINPLTKVLEMRAALLGGEEATTEYIKTGEVQDVVYPITTTWRVNQDAAKPNTTSATGGIPQRAGDIVTGIPVWEGLKTYWDFWQVLLGSPETKIETVLPYYPVSGETTENILENLKLGIAKLPPEDQKFWGQPIIHGTDITLPAWPDIGGMFKGAGKWLLIGGGVLAGVYLLGKLLGRKK